MLTWVSGGSDHPSDHCEGDPSDGLVWMLLWCRGFEAKHVGRGQLENDDVLVCAQPLVVLWTTIHGGYFRSDDIPGLV